MEIVGALWAAISWVGDRIDELLSSIRFTNLLLIFLIAWLHDQFR